MSFGQFIGQAIPVTESAQAPHILQSNNTPFAARSIAATGRSSRAKPIRRAMGRSTSSALSSPP